MSDSFYLVADVAVLLFFIAFFSIGCIRGAIRMVFKVAAQIAGFAAAYFFAPTLASWLSGLDFTVQLSQLISDWFFSDPMFLVPIESLSEGSSTLSIPGILVSLMPADPSAFEGITVSTYLGLAVGQIFVQGISFFGIMVFVSVVFTFVGSLLQKAIHLLPLFGAVDRILGAVLNTLVAFLYMSIALTIIGLFGNDVEEFISHTTVVKFFYENNPLASLFATSFDQWLEELPKMLQDLNIITPDTVLNIPGIGEVNVNELQNMITNINGFDLSKIQSILSSLGNIDPELLSKIDFSFLQNLDPSILENIDPSILENLDPSILENIDPSILQQITG